MTIFVFLTECASTTWCDQALLKHPQQRSLSQKMANIEVGVKQENTVRNNLPSKHSTPSSPQDGASSVRLKAVTAPPVAMSTAANLQKGVAFINGVVVPMPPPCVTSSIQSSPVLIIPQPFSAQHLMPFYGPQFPAGIAAGVTTPKTVKNPEALDLSRATPKSLSPGTPDGDVAPGLIPYKAKERHHMSPLPWTEGGEETGHAEDMDEKDGLVMEEDGSTSPGGTRGEVYSDMFCKFNVTTGYQMCVKSAFYKHFY